MKNISKIAAILGMSIFVFVGCSNSARQEAVQNIEEFSQEYEQAKDSIREEENLKYQMLGESVQALLDIAEKDSGNLETKEQITQTNELIEELRAELYEMMESVQESEEDSEMTKEAVEVTLTFRNESNTSAGSISVLEPQSKAEKELGTFQAGSRIETTLKLPADDLEISWFLYNENGEAIEQQTTELTEVESGATIYYTEDGIYTEIY